MATVQNGGSADDRRWRGQTDEVAELPRYRWQMTEQELREAAATPEDESKRVRFLLLLISGFVLLVFFLYWILRSPARTPLLILTESAYPASFPPNPFAEEDADRLEWLDEKNLSVYRENSLENFDEALSRIESEVYRRRVLMIYISAHGGVNSAGQPCLIPSGASPLDSRTWLPLQDVLETVARRKFSQTSDIVLFLDCQKVLFEPRMGILHNQFVSRVQRLQLEAQQAGDSTVQIPRLAIICSTSPNEVSHTFVDRRQTIFAETLFKALSGDADGGDYDEEVSLEECYRFVRNHVAEQARTGRDRRQTPTLVSTSALSRSRSPRLALALRDRIPPPVARDTGPSSQWRDTISKLWRQYERLTPQAYLDTHPDETARLQQLLLRLEAWVSAGKAYETHAISLATLLREHLQQLESQTQTSETFLDADQLNLVPADVPGLPLSQSLSDGYDEQLLELEAALQTCLLSTDRKSIRAARDQWIRSARLPLSPQFHWIELLLNNGSQNLWNDSPSLKTLLEAEQAARKIPALAHLRVFQLFEPELELADTARRNAEDLIAAEKSESLAELGQHAESAVEQYSQLEEHVGQRRQAFQLCNQIDAQLPWLWELMVRISNHDLRTARLSPILSPQSLQVLQSDSEELRRVMDSGDFPAEQYEGLSDRFAKLQNDLSMYFESVQNPEDLNLASVRLISCCLESPLITSEIRTQLWKTRTSLQEDIRRREPRASASAGRASPGATEDSAAVSAKHLALLKSGVLPLLRSIDDREYISVTKLQAGFRDELLDRYRVAEQLVAPDDDTKLAELFTGLEQQEYRGRQVAAWNLAQCPPCPGEQPDGQVRSSNASLLKVASVSKIYWRSQLQRLLLLEADRATADMWGMQSVSGKPYFQAASERLLASSAGILPAHAEIESHIAARRNLLSSRLDLMQNRIRLESDEVTILDPGLNSESRLHMQIDPISDEPAGFSWPSGRVTVTLEDSFGRCSLNSSLAGWEQFSAFGANYELPELLRFGSAPYFRDEQQLWARFFWRGHEIRNSVPFRRVSGGRTETTVAEPPQTTLNVLAEVPQPTNLLFVLDVSQSMSAKTFDRPDRSRWEVALGVLEEALSPLLGQSHLRIGVLAYGHRAGWNPQNPDELLYQPYLKDSTPPGLLPLEDVEILLGPGPLTPETMAQLQARLSMLVPWGETPLYLAIREAAELVPEESPTPTQIIVLTDGVNRQRSPEDLILTDDQKAKLISADQLASALAVQSIQLNVLGFELSTEQDAALQLELLNLIHRVGGEYFPSIEAGNLLPLIQRILGPREYAVSRSIDFLGTYPLGQQTDVERSTTDRRSVDVTVNSASAQITNDERRAIQLYYKADRYELTAKPFRTDLNQKIPIPAASAAPLSGLWLGVHQPRFTSSENDSVQLAFSIQTDTNQFVPRPEVLMVHAVAVNADGEPLGREWFYYEPQPRPDFTVPLWQLSADQWDPAAGHIVLEAYVSWNPANFESDSWTIPDFESGTVRQQLASRKYIARAVTDSHPTVFLAERRDDAEVSWPGFFKLRPDDDARRTPAWSSRHVFDEAHGIHLQTFTPLAPDADVSGGWNVDVIRPNPAETLNDQRLVTEPLPVLPAGEFLQKLP